MDTITRDLIRALRNYLRVHAQQRGHNRDKCFLCCEARVAILRAENPTDAEVDAAIFEAETLLRERAQNGGAS